MWGWLLQGNEVIEGVPLAPPLVLCFLEAMKRATLLSYVDVPAWYSTDPQTQDQGITSDTSEALGQNKPGFLSDWWAQRHKLGAVWGLGSAKWQNVGGYFFCCHHCPSSSCCLNWCQTSLSCILKHKLCVEDTWNFLSLTSQQRYHY